MKWNKIQKIGFVSAIAVLALGSTNLVSYAAPVFQATDADVGFKTDNDGTTDPLIPVDPDPTKPIQPDPNPKPTKGALRMDVTPSFDFGNNNKIKATEQKYYAKFVTGTKFSETEKTEFENYLQVTDERGGTKGWKVSVSNDGVFTSSTGDKIEGAAITLKDFSVYSGSNIKEPSMFPTVPTTAVTISDNTDHLLLNADTTKQQGYGIWTMPMGSVDHKTTGQGEDGLGTTGKIDETKAGRNPAVELKIPAGQIIQPDKAYKSVLNWNISDNL
ncbi:WxL domain-containing protein [Carnobacterium divergens]|uniref:WxL domain-containing protein n=1 Tax=Carnobacterium divergens TaxID=2748 RepID=A0AAW8R522_CARDV|nr:WxL domain-containing protein [Carnobacterium divergens]MDT1956874.1 WxL domain-containing protein [Carnobacterium divergens]MDT1972844.1 WxL domain-containing protein [Carnobacterium divergens]